MKIERDYLSILGSRSGAARAAAEQLRQAAATEIPILVTGESGTGKELAARAVHENSPRAGGPYVPLHTGATRTKPGCFEAARAGTMFLDEIATMGVQTQVSLLRVLETRRCQRVGGADFVELDFRLVAATNTDLRQEVEDGAFRLDLFHRLSVYEVRLPPPEGTGRGHPAARRAFPAILRRAVRQEDALPAAGVAGPPVLLGPDTSGSWRT